MKSLAKSERLNVLVLGVGGNVSQGILKALACSRLHCHVIGACTSPTAVGLYTADRSYVSPLARAKEFPDWLIDVCRRESVHAVLSGVEPVLQVLLQQQHAIADATGAVCVLNRPEAVAIGSDKLRTCEWLASEGLNHPAYAGADDAEAVSRLLEQVSFPLIAKPMHGKGSSGIIMIRTPRDLARIQDRSDYVLQEYLGEETSEYTVGAFTDRDDAIRGMIVFHRELLQGTTVSAEAGLYPEIRAEAERIVRALKPRGPCNIQMRMHRGKPVCFELNVRFSGTTAMRAQLGFNDVEAAVRHYVLGESIQNLPVITSGRALRYWNEVYVDEAAFSRLKSEKYLENPAARPARIEQYGIRP